MAKKVKLIVVDDHTIVRQGICQALHRQENFEVAGEADSGQSAINMVAEVLPDIVIMDINMPGMNGIQATKKVLEINPAIKVIALSMHSEKVYVAGILNIGASAYLLKTCSINELCNAINSVIAGRRYLSHDIKNGFKDDLFDDIHEEIPDPLSILTKREREILKFIADGHVTKKIAQKLNISKKTVDNHRANLKKKLGIHTTAELTKFSITQGITGVDL